MMPNNALSSEVMDSAFLFPDNIPTHALVSYEMGGVALQNASQGLRVRPWTLTLENETDITITGEGLAPEVLFSREGITEISLAFDQNMLPTVAFVEDGQAKLWWFDPVAAALTFSDLAADVITPRVSLDDKRPGQTGNSDIILGYLRGGHLYFRMQRDRYTVERLLAEDVPSPGLIRCGMNTLNRFQFLLRDPEEED